MFMVGLMIMLFCLWLHNFCCIGVMNYLKMIYYNFVCVCVCVKMSYCQLNRVKLLEKAKDRYHNGTGKKIAKYYKNKF